MYLALWDDTSLWKTEAYCCRLNKVLKTLSSRTYVKKMGNFRHVWEALSCFYVSLMPWYEFPSIMNWNLEPKKCIFSLLRVYPRYFVREWEKLLQHPTQEYLLTHRNMNGYSPSLLDWYIPSCLVPGTPKFAHILLLQEENVSWL